MDAKEMVALAHKVLVADHTPPWAAEEFEYNSDNWSDEQGRSEWFEELSDKLGGQANQLAEFVVAAFPPDGGIEYRARVQDRDGDRWSVNGPLGFLARHCAEQRLSIIWIRPLEEGL